MILNACRNLMYILASNIKILNVVEKWIKR